MHLLRSVLAIAPLATMPLAQGPVTDAMVVAAATRLSDRWNSAFAAGGIVVYANSEGAFFARRLQHVGKLTFDVKRTTSLVNPIVMTISVRLIVSENSCGPQANAKPIGEVLEKDYPGVLCGYETEDAAKAANDSVSFKNLCGRGRDPGASCFAVAIRLPEQVATFHVRGDSLVYAEGSVWIEGLSKVRSLKSNTALLASLWGETLIKQ